MASKYSASIELECWKEHVCVGCGSTFRYRLKREKSGQAPTMSAAEAVARKAAVTSLKNDVEMQPCPTCGIIQPDMVGDTYATGHGCLLVILAILLGILGVFVILREEIVLFPLYLGTWIAVGICALGALGHIWMAKRNFNRDLEANRQEAREAIQKNDLRLEKPGHLEQPLLATIPRRFGMGERIVFFLLFLGIGSFASAEIARLVSDWPLNHDCEPVVVGPGDDLTIYLSDEVSSLKGLWNGQAAVEVLNARELGLKSNRLPASSKNDNWGNYIWGKRVETKNSRLWTRIVIPKEEDLAGRKMNLNIILDVKYPAAEGSGFLNEEQTFEHAAELHLSSPHAGLVYRFLWWGGGVMGGLLVLLSGYWLKRQGNGMKREALPSRMIPIDDDEAPEVLPAE